MNPQRNDKLTQNQPEWTRASENNTSKDNYDSSASGGYGSSPDNAWSNKSQRGTDMPLTPQEVGITPDTGLIDQSTNGTNLKKELGDAKQGRDDRGFGQGSGGTAGEENVWGIEKGAEKDF
ncbi:hypothetical protein CPB83DRAFT_908493 [Crepidotus variabilis]|uniref:Uncharacterized protein n=1 Tax=Crepidotus variabilis TaxID=179855 RepID=A0A9P6ECC5_9AGAR|nr:hypothetical protein CPB83DRAFT_908493 [Crepidotus variabilis]